MLAELDLEKFKNIYKLKGYAYSFCQLAFFFFFFLHEISYN